MADFPADLAVVGVVVEETKNPDLSEPEVSEMEELLTAVRYKDADMEEMVGTVPFGSHWIGANSVPCTLLHYQGWQAGLGQ